MPSSIRSKRSVMTRVRRKMIDERGCKCEACGWRAPEYMEDCGLDLHHVIPVASGGSDDEENLLLLCGNCHSIGHWLLSHGYSMAAGATHFLGYIQRAIWCSLPQGRLQAAADISADTSSVQPLFCVVK